MNCFDLLIRSWPIPVAGMIAGLMLAQLTGGITVSSIGASVLGASTYWCIHMTVVCFVRQYSKARRLRRGNARYRR